MTLQVVSAPPLQALPLLEVPPPHRAHQLPILHSNGTVQGQADFCLRELVGLTLVARRCLRCLPCSCRGSREIAFQHLRHRCHRRTHAAAREAQSACAVERVAHCDRRVAYVAWRRSGSALERADGPARPPRGGSPWDGFSLYQGLR